MDYNTAPMQETALPQDDTMMQLDLKRKLALADALRQQESPQGQMVSGFYVAPSWTQSLAGIANKYVAGQQEKQALGQFGEYQKAKLNREQESAMKLGKALGPVAITEQGSYDIRVPNNQTPTPTDNLGGMQPYESGMKNISVPMTTTTGTRPRTKDEIMQAISEYSANTRNPAMLEKFFISQATSQLSPKQTEWKEVNGKLVGFDIYGKPTGQVIGDGKPVDYGTAANSAARGLFNKDFKDLSQPEQKKVVDYVNQFKAGNLDVARGNLGVNQQQANFTTGVPMPNQRQAKTTSIAEIQDYARKNNISYDESVQHANRLGYTVQ
jgi:hypothetical protein